MIKDRFEIYRLRDKLKEKNLIEFRITEKGSYYRVVGTRVISPRVVSEGFEWPHFLDQEPIKKAFQEWIDIRLSKKGGAVKNWKKLFQGHINYLDREYNPSPWLALKHIQNAATNGFQGFTYTPKEIDWIRKYEMLLSERNLEERRKTSKHAF